MIYTTRIQEGINLALQTHELDERQKRKGNDLPYIIHPLTVALILAKAGANEDLIIAGILHDTIEDSIEAKKVTKKIIEEKFGANVAELVWSVTEENKALPWDVRKAEALKHIENFTNDMVLLKSADLISNANEVYLNFEKDGDKVFECFGAGKERTIANHANLANALLEKWPQSPLAPDLKAIVALVEKMK